MIDTLLDVLWVTGCGLLAPAGGMALVMLVLWLTPWHGRCKQCGGKQHVE